MATMTFSDLADLLFENYGNTVLDNLIRQGPGNWFMSDQSILGRLRARGRISIGGDDGNDRYVADWAVKFTGKTAASFGGSDAYPAATQPTWGDAKIGWKRNGVLIDIDNLMRLASRGSARGGITGLGAQFNDALKALVHAIETQMAGDGTGNGGKDVDGFKAWLSTANTYATIDQSGQALWQSNIVPGGSAALSMTLMRTMVRAAYNRNAIDDGTEIWMDLLQFQKFSTLFDQYVRYMPGDRAGAVIPHYTDGAFAIPIYVVKGVPTDEVWMPNVLDIKKKFLDHTPEDELSQVSDEEIMYEGMPIGLEPVETGKDSKAIFVKAYSNAVCVNPYRQSAITGLATTAP